MLLIVCSSDFYYNCTSNIIKHGDHQLLDIYHAMNVQGSVIAELSGGEVNWCKMLWLQGAALP